MKTPEEIQDHKDAIAQAFALDPKNVIYSASWGSIPADGLGWLHVHPERYSIKPQPAIAPGNNPHGLTVEQVGDGFRLLDAHEIKHRINTIEYLSAWEHGKWNNASIWGGSDKSRAYRTKLSREQLALLDKNEGWIPWFGEGEIPKGRVDVVSSIGKQINDSDSTFWESVWPSNARGASIIAYRPVKQPEYVPWNRLVIPTLPFEVRSKATGHRYCITAANEHSALVNGSGWTKYHTLLSDFTLPSGEPCGTKGEA